MAKLEWKNIGVILLNKTFTSLVANGMFVGETNDAMANMHLISPIFRPCVDTDGNDGRLV